MGGHWVLDVGERATRLPAAGEADATGVQIAASGRRFCVPGKGQVDLSTRDPLRRILKALADGSTRLPVEPLGVDALMRIGWPGQSLGPEAGASRVYNAMSALRRMGLKPYLVRRDDGYLLDPRARVERLPDG